VDEVQLSRRLAVGGAMLAFAGFGALFGSNVAGAVPYPPNPQPPVFPFVAPGPVLSGPVPGVSIPAAEIPSNSPGYPVQSRTGGKGVSDAPDIMGESTFGILATVAAALVGGVAYERVQRAR
jgi:hypothetical protein